MGEEIRRDDDAATGAAVDDLPSFMVFQNMMMAASRFMPAMR
jgi:hypothetical protein